MATKARGGMHKKTKAAVGIGIGVTAALASAAGAYFLYGSKHADQNRKKVRSWALKAKADVLEGLETAQNMSKEDYEKLVDRAVKGYSKLKDVKPGELVALAREMKAHWKELEKKGDRGTRAAKKTAKKTARKATKKS
jgi:hypothetical protein